jgi:lipoprotein-anchoring transpeptidase ErfK/SrfK
VKSVRRQLGVTAVIVAAMVVAGCTSSGDPATSSGPTVSSSAGPVTSTASAPASAVPVTTPPAAPAVLSVVPAANASTVDPAAPITASVAGGTLEKVSLIGADGAKVTGKLSADGTTWKSDEDLGYAKTYTLTVSAKNTDGVAVKKVSKFSTVNPDNQTMPYFNTTGGAGITDGATYGVGMVVMTHWDEPIANKAAAVKTLTVTTTPHVNGAWYWLDDQNVLWRPKAYYTPGTKVSVTAQAYGAEVGPGLYGQADASTHFVIGARHVSIADDTTHTVSVYDGNKLVRKMPTSMGRGGYVQGTEGTISLYTPSGSYTVIGRGNPVLMDSSTFGLPTTSSIGYKENIYYATQISTDGIYLHELDTTVWAQGNTDTSHGCLNLNRDNAMWFYGWSQIGDPVIVEHTGGAPLADWQGGSWSVPWATWVKGGHLNDN